MPAKTPTNVPRGTSPSKNIDRAAQTAWGAQNQSSTTAKDALSKKYTKDPVPVSGKK